VRTAPHERRKPAAQRVGWASKKSKARGYQLNLPLSLLPTPVTEVAAAAALLAVDAAELRRPRWRQQQLQQR